MLNVQSACITMLLEDIIFSLGSHDIFLNYEVPDTRQEFAPLVSSWTVLNDDFNNIAMMCKLLRHQMPSTSDAIVLLNILAPWLP